MNIGPACIFFGVALNVFTISWLRSNSAAIDILSLGLPLSSLLGLCIYLWFRVFRNESKLNVRLRILAPVIGVWATAMTGLYYMLVYSEPRLHVSQWISLQSAGPILAALLLRRVSFKDWAFRGDGLLSISLLIAIAFLKTAHGSSFFAGFETVAAVGVTFLVSQICMRFLAGKAPAFLIHTTLIGTVSCLWILIQFKLGTEVRYDISESILFSLSLVAIQAALIFGLSKTDGALGSSLLSAGVPMSVLFGSTLGSWKPMDLFVLVLAAFYFVLVSRGLWLAVSRPLASK